MIEVDDLVEISNDMDKQIFVKVCRSKSTNRIFVHISNKESNIHLASVKPIPVQTNNYALISVEDVVG